MNHQLLPSQRHKRQRLPVFALVALLVSACGGSPDATRSSILNRGSFSEPESLDVHKAKSLQAGDVQRDLGEGLAGYGPGG